MDFENIKEGKFIQKLPLFEKENFLEWKSDFESYVKSIDQDLWHVISIGDFKPKTSLENKRGYPNLYKNIKAKKMIYKALPKNEYEKVFSCETANDIWKNILNRHQEICQVKDDQFDLTYELEVLAKLIDRHLVEVNTCATSLNVLNEGTSEDEDVCHKELACESWNETDVDEDNDPVGDCQLVKTTSKVHVETKHFCFDTFILEFSKLENESKLLGNTNLKTIFNNKSSKSFVNNFEKEIMLEDIMSKLESSVEIDLGCKICLDHKHEIKRQNEKGKMLAKFDESSKSLERVLRSQRLFRDKTGLGFSSKAPSTCKTKQVKFVKPRREI